MMVNAEGFKGGDKTSIDLPKVQRELLAELRKTGKPVVFVLCTGSSLGLAQDEKNYDALLNAWYGGQSGGTAVADVLAEITIHQEDYRLHSTKIWNSLTIIFLKPANIKVLKTTICREEPTVI
jgi:hypothetical protein